MLAAWLPDRFCTGIAAELDVATGELGWCNGAHPPPLLIRDQEVLDRALERPAKPPLGMPARLASTAREVHRMALEPGDRVLLCTDGVTEARLANGPQFGLEHFSHYIIRATASGRLASETLSA
ncbi:PP2C family protein-serine/threonine phosphatase [Streptomyces niveus]|uniref:PP2C family protein-serine/threonine phosphatase n=1 Tax=Streptomyces niveus TaxID=193462 RepID=UPI00386A5BDB|nr:PP2C family protein-serine/threonine phosphatase [Streptomyces niveus]